MMFIDVLPSPRSERGQLIPYLSTSRLRTVGMTRSRDKNARNDSVPNFRGLFLPNQCGKQPFTNSFPREECSSTENEEPAHYSHHLLRWLSEFRFTRRPCSQYLALYPGILFFRSSLGIIFHPGKLRGSLKGLVVRSDVASLGGIGAQKSGQEQ